MKEVEVSPTELDVEIARAAAQHATPAIEYSLQAITYVADERLLLVAAGAVWIASRFGNAAQRRQGAHLGITVLAAAIVPHILKRIVRQRRPDRSTPDKRRRGIPTSGRADDAFPSGHAMHMGAIGAAISHFYPSAAPVAWTICGALAATRVALEAHWTSDVLVGFAAGVLVEKSLRPMTLKTSAS